MKEKEEMKAWMENHQAMVKRKNDKYNASFDRVTFMVPKGRKQDIQARAAALGLSVNAYVSGLVLDDIDKNN